MAAVDASFTVLFAMELLIRRRQVPSWRSFFWTHEDASWHCFDTVVVGLSFASIYLQQNAADDGQGGFFSMFRLLRVTRLARVVRFFRVFKQLTVMLLSLIDGMKTLVWAACLLLLILFIVACLLIFVNEDLISSLHDTPFAVLFESLPMVMYILFECMTEGCSNNIVRPLVQETGYRSLVVAYSFFTVFTVFGVLNLFTAMFVDNTMEAARLNEDRYRQTRDKQSRFIARKLKAIVEKLEAEAAQEGSDGSSAEGADKRVATCEELLSAAAFFEKNEESHIARKLRDIVADAERSNPQKTHSGEYYTKQTFNQALQTPEVRKLLFDLDINDTDHIMLFDVLDANSSGLLSVQEVVQGLMSVQGQARALDTVAVRLGMRAVQRQLTKQQDSFDTLAEELALVRKEQRSHRAVLQRLRTDEANQTSNPVEIGLDRSAAMAL
jgi:hypothetical protein